MPKLRRGASMYEWRRRKVNRQRRRFYSGVWDEDEAARMQRVWDERREAKQKALDRARRELEEYDRWVAEQTAIQADLAYRAQLVTAVEERWAELDEVERHMALAPVTLQKRLVHRTGRDDHLEVGAYKPERRRDPAPGPVTVRRIEPVDKPKQPLTKWAEVDARFAEHGLMRRGAAAKRLGVEVTTLLECVRAGNIPTESFEVDGHLHLGIRIEVVEALAIQIARHRTSVTS